MSLTKKMLAICSAGVTAAFVTLPASAWFGRGLGFGAFGFGRFGFPFGFGFGGFGFPFGFSSTFSSSLAFSSMFSSMFSGFGFSPFLW